MTRRFLAVFLFACLTVGLLPNHAWSQNEDDVYDPWEGFNRRVFWFNDKVDVYVLEPVAQGYDDITPNRVQKGVTNFFDNLGYPKYLLSDLVQLKFGQAGDHTLRFLINSTIGLVGLVDVANDFGIPPHDEDFGIALAYQGVPPGPYLVLPLLGPSNVRDTFGRIVDTAVHPFSILGYSNVKAGITDRVSYGGRAVELVDTRANLLEAIEAARSSSVDYYLFMQGAYSQHRRGVLYDGNPPDVDEILDSSGAANTKEDPNSLDD